MPGAITPLLRILYFLRVTLQRFMAMLVISRQDAKTPSLVLVAVMLIASRTLCERLVLLASLRLGARKK